MNVLALAFSPSQWLVLVVVCLLIFGFRRLPGIARSIGSSFGEFRKGRREMEQELRAGERPRNPHPDAIDVAVVEKPGAGEPPR